MERRTRRRRSSQQQQPASTNIDDLPDEILCQIISLLSLKDAIRTGAVKKRWRYFWNSKTSWEIDSSFFLQMKRRRDKFEGLVDHIVYFHKGPGIRNLKLLDKYYNRNSQRARRWIDYLVSKGIRQLDINIHYPIQPPISLFTSESLGELKLCLYDLFIRLPSTVTMNGLKDLHLERVKFRDSKSLQNLISGCPKLINLYLKECFGSKEKIKDLPIFHSTLKVFVLANYYFLKGPKLHISTPGLATFEFRGNGLLHMDHVFNDMSSVNEAVIELEGFNVDYSDWRAQGPPGDRGYRMVQLLKALHNATILSLSEFCIEYLSAIADDLGPLCAACQKLESVRLSMWPNGGHAHIVTSLMESCPKLQALNITVIQAHVHGVQNEHRANYPETADFLSKDIFHFHLKRVEIKNFGGSEDEHRLVKFILVNALVLERMDITTSRKMDLDIKDKLFDEINSYPRTSTAEIKIS